MEIFPSEVVGIEDMGELDGAPIKMLRLRGGLFMAVSSQKGKESVLGSASHRAILSHNIQKAHSNFRPSMMKSEQYQNQKVRDISSNLSPESIKQGLNMYEVEESGRITISLTKHSIEQGSTVLRKTDKGLKQYNVFKQLTPDGFKALSKAIINAGVARKMDIIS